MTGFHRPTVLILLYFLGTAGAGNAFAAPGPPLSPPATEKIPGVYARAGLAPDSSSLCPPLLQNCEGKKEMIEKQAARILAELKSIELNEIKYDEPGPQPFGFIPGTIPVLISAPHGAKHLRKDYWKAEDEYTSSLAVVLGRLTGAHVLFVRNRIPEDPNKDANSRYKDLLQQIVRKYGVRFVIDLHGSARGKPYKLDVGVINVKTGKNSCPTYLKVIQNAFAGFQSPLFNQIFCARGKGTITSFCRNQLGIEAAQFEINADYRVLQGKTGEPLQNCGIHPQEKHILQMITRLALMIHDIHHKMDTCRPGPGQSGPSEKEISPAAVISGKPLSAQMLKK